MITKVSSVGLCRLVHADLCFDNHRVVHQEPIRGVAQFAPRDDILPLPMVTAEMSCKGVLEFHPAALIVPAALGSSVPHGRQHCYL